MSVWRLPSSPGSNGLNLMAGSGGSQIEQILGQRSNFREGHGLARQWWAMERRGGAAARCWRKARKPHDVY